MNRKYQERCPRLISIEKSVYDKMQELLPKGITLSDEINAYFKDILGEYDKVMNHRKYECRYPTMVSFEKKIYDRMQEILPKGVTISDEINAFLRERVLAYETENNSPIIEKGAVKTNNGNGNGSSTIIEQKQAGEQQTLDIYWSNNDLVKYVNSITDIETLKKLMKNGRLVSQLAETQMKKLQGTFKQKFKEVKLA
jgi:6-pyruvoyl-tetrahydropterin synthase